MCSQKEVISLSGLLVGEFTRQELCMAVFYPKSLDAWEVKFPCTKSVIVLKKKKRYNSLIGESRMFESQNIKFHIAHSDIWFVFFLFWLQLLQSIAVGVQVAGHHGYKHCHQDRQSAGRILLNHKTIQYNTIQY